MNHNGVGCCKHAESLLQHSVKKECWQEGLWHPAPAAFTKVPNGAGKAWLGDVECSRLGPGGAKINGTGTVLNLMLPHRLKSPT